MIDVDVEGEPAQIVAPQAPTALKSDAVGTTTAELHWTAPGGLVNNYRVLRDGVAIDTTSGTSFTDEGLQTGTDYSYTVVATNAAGESTPSDALVLTTAESGQTEMQPPRNLHSMGATPQSIDLMWFSPVQSDDVAGYRVYRDGAEIATTPKRMLLDTGLAPGSEYHYVVRALDADGNESADSNQLIVKTKADSDELPQWNARAAYTKGDRVSHNGRTYQAVQSYQGHGDPNWINALSLWNQID